MPENTEQARWNVRAALDLFTKGKYKIDRRLLCDPTGILRGDPDLIFGLLYSIMQLYPKSLNFSSQEWHKLSQKSHWLPYTPLERLRLEQCLVEVCGREGEGGWVAG